MHYACKTTRHLTSFWKDGWGGKQTALLTSLWWMPLWDWGTVPYWDSWRPQSTVRSPWKNRVFESFTGNHLVLLVLRKVKNESLTDIFPEPKLWMKRTCMYICMQCVHTPVCHTSWILRLSLFTFQCLWNWDASLVYFFQCFVSITTESL